MSRIVPLTGSEASRTTQAAQVNAQEVHTTSDQQRLFVENRVVAPHWHGAVASQALMLALANRKSATTISAASGDNSFNDSGAGFPAWAPGDVLTVDGFLTNADNNGAAFTVVSRTASKIVVSGGTLVTEAAGDVVTLTKNGTPGCWPGDKCRRSDLGTIWECVSNNGGLIGDWVEVTTDRIGLIVMWSGSLSDLPTGYALCDGSGGTPDLRDKFIQGKGAATAIGDTGGNVNHSHAVGTLAFTGTALGTHTHTAGSYDTPATSAGTPAGTINDHGRTAVGAGSAVDVHTSPTTHAFTGTALASHSHGVSGNSGATSAGTPAGTISGSTATTDGRPPFYVLAFLKRVS
jgi:hypothetical protein